MENKYNIMYIFEVPSDTKETEKYKGYVKIGKTSGYFENLPTNPETDPKVRKYVEKRIKQELETAGVSVPYNILYQAIAIDKNGNQFQDQKTKGEMGVHDILKIDAFKKWDEVGNEWYECSKEVAIGAIKWRIDCLNPNFSSEFYIPAIKYKTNNIQKLKLQFASDESACPSKILNLNDDLINFNPLKMIEIYCMNNSQVISKIFNKDYFSPSFNNSNYYVIIAKKINKKTIINDPIICCPNQKWTSDFLAVGPFDFYEDACFIHYYLKTKFCRYFLSLLLNKNQFLSPNCFADIPFIIKPNKMKNIHNFNDFEKEFENILLEKYNFTQNDLDFIANKIDNLN